MKSKYGKNFRLCYMDSNFSVYHIETNNFFKDIAGDVEARFDTSGCGQNRPLPIGVNKKVIGFMKDKLGRSHDRVHGTKAKAVHMQNPQWRWDKKCKGVKKCMVRKILDFDDYKHCLFTNMSQSENMYWKQLMFQNKLHEVHMVKVNKVALNRDDNK